MQNHKLLLTLLAICAALVATACSSQPEIPDQQQTYTYRSTDDQEGEDKPIVASRPEGDPEDPAAADTSKEPIRAKGDVAIVNGKPISAAEFNAELDKLVSSGQIPASVLGSLKERLVRGMVDKRLLDDAVATANIAITEADIDAKIKEVKEDFERVNALSSGQMGSFDMMLKRMGLDPDNLRGSIKQAIIIEKLVKAQGFDPIKDEEVKSFYDENIKRFKQPERVRARHILIKVEEGADDKAWADAKTKIVAIRADIIKTNKDFAQAAKDSSEGPSGPRGGDLGYFTKGRMVPEFEQAAWSLKKDEISQPVKTPFGWHLIKKEDHQPDGPMPFDQIKDLLKSQLNNQKFQQSLIAYLESLRSKAKIELKLDNIS